MFSWKCKVGTHMEIWTWLVYMRINSSVLKMELRMSVGRELSTSSHFDPNILLSFTLCSKNLQLLEDTRSFSFAFLCQIVIENDFIMLKQPESLISP
jgi:hypothetical protein